MTKKLHAILFIILLLISGMLHQLLYFIYPYLALFQQQTRNFSLRKTPAVKLFYYLLITVTVFTVIQFAIALDIRLFSIKGVARYLSYFSIAVVLSTFDRKDLYKILCYSSLMLILLTPISILQVIQIERAKLFFMHSNHMAYLLVLLLFFTYGYTSGRYRLLVLLFLFLNLLLTKSTGALLATVLAFTILTLKGKSYFLIIGAAIIGIVAVSAFPIIFNRIFEQVQFLTLFDFDVVIDKATDAKFGGMGSGIWRLTYWIAIFFEFFTHSFHEILFGLGTDSMTEGNFPISIMYLDPHNDYLKVLVEFGVVGFLFFASFIGFVYKITNKNIVVLLIFSLPMFFGNILVNFPYMSIFIVLIDYISRDRLTAYYSK